MKPCMWSLDIHLARVFEIPIFPKCTYTHRGSVACSKDKLFTIIYTVWLLK